MGGGWLGRGFGFLVASALLTSAQSFWPLLAKQSRTTGVTWMCCRKTLKNYYGKGVDIHAMIGKLPAPAKGWTLPGHNYTGPYNPLDKQLDYDPETGSIRLIFQQPSGPSDAVAMQHAVDYTSCDYRAKKYGEDKKKCKNVADRKMVKSLDAIPWKQRQWGHALAPHAIKSKQKLGLGLLWKSFDINKCLQLILWRKSCDKVCWRWKNTSPKFLKPKRSSRCNRPSFVVCWRVRLRISLSRSGLRAPARRNRENSH